MKKIILSYVLVILLASCSNSKDEALQARQFTIDSLHAVAAKKETERKNTEHQHLLNHAKAVPSANTSETSPDKKKGWSNVTKGAVIGGVVGAATGVAVSKNKVKGGIIGGVLGAGVGAGTGALIKKKE